MNDNTRIELEALITEREGMVAYNQQWQSFMTKQRYIEKDFIELSGKMRALKVKSFYKLGEVVPVKDLKNFLQCSNTNCNRISEGEGKIAGDICPAIDCPGVLRKGR